MPRSSDEALLARIITWAAAMVAVLVSLVVPANYLWLSWKAQTQDTDITARLHATFVTQALNLSQADWRADIQGLLDEPLVEQPLPERRVLSDLAGAVVTSSGAAPAWPEVEASVVLSKGGTMVGQLIVARSMRPVLQTALIVALVCSALGVASYFMLRVLPLRALQRALNALAAEQARSRHELEQYVHVLFERAVDGIVVLDADGIIGSCNPRAAAMFGVAPQATLGSDIRSWLKPAVAGPEAAGLVLKEGQIITEALRHDGDRLHWFPCELTVSVLPIAGRDAGLVCTVRDLTERRLAEEHHIRLANYDGLTGLPNRGLFRDRLGQAMQRARRSGRSMALMFLDLDRFKTINDSLGHHVGDQLLQHVAQALTTVLRETDSIGRAGNEQQLEDFTVARLGGDEFTVIAEGLVSAEEAAHIARRIQRVLEAPFYAGTAEIIVTTSVGITLFPQDDSPLDELLKHADMAMYRAKDLGRNGYQFYSVELNADATRRLQMEARLRHALERQEFVLHYQPKLDLRTGAITGVEALIRWQPAGQPLVSPSDFVPLLEDSGLILPVGEWVMTEAAAQVMRWQAAGLPPLRIAVNLSARQLRQGYLVPAVRGVLDRTGLPAHLLELELTESMLMVGEAHVPVMSELAAMGVEFAIDDFGTGYSSLSYLRRFCVGTLKIDRSFVRDTPADPQACAIARAVIAMAKSLNLRVVAEGVELASQKSFLAASGCDEIQGYHLARPLDAPGFEAWWKQRMAQAPGCGAPAPAGAGPAALIVAESGAA